MSEDDLPDARQVIEIHDRIDDLAPSKAARSGTVRAVTAQSVPDRHGATV